MIGDSDVDGGFVDVDFFLMVGLSVKITSLFFLRPAAEILLRCFITCGTRSSGVSSPIGIPAVIPQGGSSFVLVRRMTLFLPNLGSRLGSCAN